MTFKDFRLVRELSTRERDNLLDSRSFFAGTYLRFIYNHLDRHPETSFKYEGVKAVAMPMNLGLWAKMVFRNQSETYIYDKMALLEPEQGVGVHIFNISSDKGIRDPLFLAMQGLETVAERTGLKDGIKGVSYYSLTGLHNNTKVWNKLVGNVYSDDYALSRNGHPIELFRSTPEGLENKLKEGYEVVGRPEMVRIKPDWMSVSS